MRIHGTLAQQARAVVDIKVAAVLRKEFTHPGHLARVLRDMTLYVNIRVLARQAAAGFELAWGRSGGETRRDRIVQAVGAVPALDECLAFAVAGVRSIAQILRAVAIHHHLARDHAHAACLRRDKKRFGRLRMHRAEHQCGGGAVFDQAVQEKARCRVRVGAVGELALFGKREALQPVEQLRAMAGDHIDLRVVHMGIDEARHDQMAAPVFDAHVRPEGRKQI